MVVVDGGPGHTERNFVTLIRLILIYNIFPMKNCSTPFGARQKRTHSYTMKMPHPIFIGALLFSTFCQTILIKKGQKSHYGVEQYFASHINAKIFQKNSSNLINKNIFTLTEGSNKTHRMAKLIHR